MILSDLGGRTAFDFIEQHAFATPDRIAITGSQGEVSWARFYQDAKRVAHALSEAGIGPGRVVAISHPGRYLHWVLVIACESLGAISGSFESSADDARQLLDLADIVLTPDRIADLLAETASSNQHPRHPATHDAPVRIARTSGSTGTPKCMMITRRMQSYWIASMAIHNSLGAATRFYVAYPASVNPSYCRMETCLRLGATVIFGAASQDLITYDATHCWLLPRDMVTLLQGARGTWPSARPLQMILGGGPVSAALHDQTAALLGTPVQIVYAANETGFIALQDRDGIGTVLPEVDLEILGEDGQPAPAGIAGTIAIRTPGLVEAYLRDPEASRRFFQRGRFLTDDAGILLPDGRVRILGRRSEILNLGGIKLTPASIEDALRTDIAGLRDVAVTSLINADGIEEICVAAVSDGSISQSALSERIQGALPQSIGRFWLMPLERLPVGASGKLQRSALKEMFSAESKSRG